MLIFSKAGYLKKRIFSTQTIKYTLPVFFIGMQQTALKAQNADSAIAIVQYNVTYVADTTKRDQPQKNSMILYLGRHSSYYADMRALEMNERVKAYIQQHPEVITENQAINLPNSFCWYKDVVNNKLVNITRTARNVQKIFFVEESMPVIQWTITSETKIIGGYNCQKATAIFRGRIYAAWFCKQLPYSNGPWKLGGLPGLILEAADVTNEIVFSFKSFETNAVAVAITLPEGGIKTSSKDLNKYLETIRLDGAAMMQGSGAARGRSAQGGSNGQDGPPPQQGEVNNPLEKENGL